MYDKNSFKKSFLESSSNKSYYSLEEVFDYTAKVEAKYDLDLIEMDLEQLVEALGKIEYRAVRNLKNTCTGLKKYFKAYGKPIMNTFSFDDLANICINLSNPVFTLEYLAEIEEDINKDRSSGWFYNFVMYATFYGMTAQEIMHLRIRDIDDGGIRLKDSILELEKVPKLKYYLDRTIKFKSEFMNDPKHKLPYIGIYEDSVIKTQVKKDLNVENSLTTTLRRTVTPLIQRVADNKTITLMTIYNSGLVYYVEQRLSSQYKRTLKQCFDALREDVEYFYLYKCIKEFGSSKSVEDFKFLIKDYVK